jgi:hypothetical protein
MYTLCRPLCPSLGVVVRDQGDLPYKMADGKAQIGGLIQPAGKVRQIKSLSTTAHTHTHTHTLTHTHAHTHTHTHTAGQWY